MEVAGIDWAPWEHFENVLVSGSKKNKDTNRIEETINHSSNILYGSGQKTMGSRLYMQDWNPNPNH